MIAVLPLLFRAALVFVPQDVPDVAIGPPNPYSGAPNVNFRQADLDADGKQDLILSRAVYLQNEGAFPAQGRVPLPHASERPYADVAGAAIYLRFADRLIVLRWKDGALAEELDQPFSWPTAAASETSLWDTGRETGVHFDRFIYDLDNNGVSEIVALGPDGIHVYTRKEGTYAQTALLDLLPPLALARVPAQDLWPPDARHVLFPARQMACRCVIENGRILVLSREDTRGQRVCYRETRCTLEAERGFQAIPESLVRTATEPMPAGFVPCRLNDDDTVDYAGGDWELSNATALPTPIFETRATLDGGKTVQAFRSQSFRPQCSFADMNHDGRLDLITETTGLSEGGIRETITRFLTVREVHHAVQVRFQNEAAVLSKDPDMATQFTIELDAPPANSSPFFQRYSTGELVDVSGDFNGDGNLDLLVQDRADRLAVMLNHGAAFSPRPDAVIAVEPEDRFGVADIDGDGRSDIANFQAPGAAGKAKAFFAREGTP